MGCWGLRCGTATMGLPLNGPFADRPRVQVFEVHISHPHELCVLTRMEEYRALRAANARFFGNPTQPVGHLEQELMAGNRIYLQVCGFCMEPCP